MSPRRAHLKVRRANKRAGPPSLACGFPGCGIVVATLRAFGAVGMHTHALEWAPGFRRSGDGTFQLTRRVQEPWDRARYNRVSWTQFIAPFVVDGVSPDRTPYHRGAPRIAALRAIEPQMALRAEETRGGVGGVAVRFVCPNGHSGEWNVPGMRTGEKCAECAPVIPERDGVYEVRTPAAGNFAL